MRTVREIQNEIENLKKKIKTIQDQCEHKSYIVKKYVRIGPGELSGYFLTCNNCDKSFRKATYEEVKNYMETNYEMIL